MKRIGFPLNQKDSKENGNSFSRTEFKVSDSIFFLISYLEANGLIVKKTLLNWTGSVDLLNMNFELTMKPYAELDIVKLQKTIEYFNKIQNLIYLVTH